MSRGGLRGEEFSLSLGGRGEPCPDHTDIILNIDFASEWHLQFQTQILPGDKYVSFLLSCLSVHHTL